MARPVKQASVEGRRVRRKLAPGRQAHWRTITPHRVHLGYQRWPHDNAGRWIVRRNVGGAYRIIPLGLADDVQEADGARVLSFQQAHAAAVAVADEPAAKMHAITVRKAMENYVAFKTAQGQPIKDLVSRTNAHILPILGDKIVSELTAEQLRRWLADMAAAPAQTRPKGGTPQYQRERRDDEGIRKRRASANRVLSMLKAALNHAYDEGHINNRDAWGRKLKPFRDVEVARIRYLTVAEAQRLLNGCDSEFRPLMQAALETGCRYGELIRLQVHDFNSDAGTVAIRKSKSGKARHVVLTDEGSAFFRQHSAGRAGSALMFVHGDGRPWQASEQGRLMTAANEHARLKPPITFHGLRHTWASLAVMNGVPLMVIAKNLGHANTTMAQKHYAHLAPSYVTDVIRAGAPKFGFQPDRKVTKI